ncbi:MAG: ABC transporter permease [Culicoidibacterales bacterium]
MKYLHLKLRRDVKNNWTQFFSVFLMAMLSVAIFVGLQGAWHGLEISVNTYIKDSKLPESWVYGTNFDANDVNSFKQIKGVDTVVEKTRIKATESRDDVEKYISLDTFDGTHQVPHLVSGESISLDMEKSVWLNQEYATANNISVGQSIEMKLSNHTTKLTVKGLIQAVDKMYYTGTLEFIAPNYANYGYGLVSEKTVKDHFGYTGGHNILEIYGTPSDIRKEAEGILGGKQIAYYDQHTLVEVSEPLDRVGQIRNLSFLFSFIFILLAILAMYTTIRRLIDKQTKDIAVLKALGFSNREIGWHYASFGLLIGGLGSFAGTLIAPLMSFFVLETQKSMFSIPTWTIAYSFSSLAVIILVISICVLSAVLASRSAISGLPALFLRGEGEKKGKTIFAERFRRFWKSLKVEYRWAFRDATLNKVRVLMGVIGVSGGMMLLVAGVGMPQSIMHLVDKAYTNDFSYEYRLETHNYKKMKDNYTGQWVQITQARFTPDDGYNRLLIVLGEGDYVHMKTLEGTGVKEGGLYVTKGFADLAKLHRGDMLSLTSSLDGKEYTLPIDGIITSETNQGAYIMQKTWENAGGEFQPQTLLTGNTISMQDIKDDPNITSVISIEEQKANANQFVMSLMSVFMMIIAFAILLVIVVLYNLGSLNFVERTRDYATLRVLGFHKKEIRNITMTENIVTTFIGWIIGIPMGIWFLDQYVRTFSTIRLEYTSYVNSMTIIIATLIVWTFSMTTTLLVSRRIQKLDMVEVLKGVE